MKPWTSALAGILALVTLLGAKTTVTDTNKKTAEGPVRKVLVVAVTKDPVIRSNYEDVFAGELQLRGASATPSHKIFPELPKDKNDFENRIRVEGYDSVALCRLVGQSDKFKYHEGQPFTYETDYVGMSVWGGYMYTAERTFDPGYLTKETRIRLRTDLFRTSETGGRLVWSVTSETIDPHTLAQVSRDVGAGVAKAMKKAKLL